MGTAHFAFWPPHSERNLITPATNLFYNAEVSATRYPDKAYLVFYDSRITFAQFHHEALRVAGYLEKHCSVVHGDRVLLLMQNSPQFILGYYGILRANAVVVPLNPMSVTQELAAFIADSGARTMLVSQELYPRVEPLLRDGLLDHVIVSAYSDYLTVETTLPVPDVIRAPRLPIAGKGITLWKDVLAADRHPGPVTAGPEDLAVMPYTSGTTGQPKGCIHTHRTMMQTTVGSMTWLDCKPEMTFLAVAPFFHVTGMQSGMNGPLYIGNTLVLLPRWDRDVAAQLVDRYRVGGWTAVPTMIQDFFLNPNLEKYDVRSIKRLSGGGAAMPAAVAQRLLDIGITYVEGYGLSETAAATHINPQHHAKKQCLGIPIYDVDSRVVDPITLRELPPGETGEIVTHGPQVFQGYWNKPEDTAAVFVEIDGKRFLRTGDLGRTDEEGYFFMVDRLKRMINASGYKIWPAEVESTMYTHPAVKEACVIGTRDDYRGETVKAVIVLKPDCLQTTAQEILDWSRENMAAYKAPRVVELVDSLPKSGSGKIMWRELQEKESAAKRG